MAGELAIENVSKTFANVTALQGVSLNIASGEFVTFLGPSGCGKTTLLRIIAGFESATSGDVHLDGKSILRLEPFRRPIGMVFQNLALFPHLTVAGNVGFGLSVRREKREVSRQKISNILNLLGLGGFEERRVFQLSGGQRQRVALARALVTEPAVLLLDEPLSALDLKLRRQLQGELKQLQHRTGTTFVFVTHDQEEAMAMSDRVAVFNAGRIEQFGAPDEIYRRPASRFVAEFVGETNLLTARRIENRFVLEDFNRPVLPATAAPGQQEIQVSVRPEDVKLVSETGLAAKIAEMEFGGAMVRLQVEALSGRRLRVTVPSSAGIGLRAGEVVHLDVDAEHCCPITASGA
ncbi:ABC transporter ATP-binding protein [Rhodoligotrophos ferricapiens]|uniref:ABC transporter ATP-binding protein n=1 Tax=Rhodoligotrophos ferricapiens TaxID=3069264 RepID=UPI00315D069F